MKIYLALFLAVGILSNCSRNPKCWGEDKNSGIIISSIDDQLLCFPKTGEKTFVIDNDSIYKQTFPATCSLTVIDFSTNTLLGQYASGGCELKFLREVALLSNENKYHYKITVNNCGFCKKLGFSYNWVLVPKLPNGWQVSFETKSR